MTLSKTARVRTPVCSSRKICSESASETKRLKESTQRSCALLTHQTSSDRGCCRSAKRGKVVTSAPGSASRKASGSSRRNTKKREHEHEREPDQVELTHIINPRDLFRRRSSKWHMRSRHRRRRLHLRRRARAVVPLTECNSISKSPRNRKSESKKRKQKDC